MGQALRFARSAARAALFAAFRPTLYVTPGWFVGPGGKRRLRFATRTNGWFVNGFTPRTSGALSCTIVAVFAGSDFK
jgi:hypothetical protein